VRLLLTRDRRAVLRFLRERGLGGTGVAGRARLVRDFVRVTNGVRGYHTLGEMLEVAAAILERPAPTVVECGCAKGGSTAKLSLAARRAGGRLVAFDSFRGIPENEERHEHLDGRPVVFRAGAFRGTIGSVRRTVECLGAPDCCTLVKGLFEDTLPGFDEPVDVAFVDVDLLASVRTCLKALVPRLRPDGVAFSHDGHLRAVRELLGSERFWRDEVGVAPPRLEGLGQRRLVTIRPADRPE
jgi:hypothetical protein